MRNPQIAEAPQKRDGAGKGAWTGKQRSIYFPVALLQSVGLLALECVADFAGHGAREQTAAHADAPVHAPAIDRQARLRERLLPGEHMGVHRIDQGAVEVEDQRAHGDIVV